MIENVVELGASSNEEKENIRESAHNVINNSHSFVIIYREALSRNWRFMYSSISDDDLIVIGALLQSKGIKGDVDE